MGYDSLLSYCYLGVLPHEIEEGILLKKVNSCLAAFLSIAIPPIEKVKISAFATRKLEFCSQLREKKE